MENRQSPTSPRLVMNESAVDASSRCARLSDPTISWAG